MFAPRSLLPAVSLLFKDVSNFQRSIFVNEYMSSMHGLAGLSQQVAHGAVDIFTCIRTRYLFQYTTSCMAYTQQLKDELLSTLIHQRAYQSQYLSDLRRKQVSCQQQ